MKNSNEGFEQNIEFLIKGNHTLNNMNNTEVGRTIICAYSLNEEKGLQE